MDMGPMMMWMVWTTDFIFLIDQFTTKKGETGKFILYNAFCVIFSILFMFVPMFKKYVVTMLNDTNGEKNETNSERSLGVVTFIFMFSMDFF